MPTFNTTDPKPGYVYEVATDTWFPLAGIATQSLDGLTDVVITTASNGQTLIYNGTNWVNTSEVGDVSAVSAGTGITVTNGAGPIPSIAIDTATTVDLNTAQTLTTKTLTAPIINITLNAQAVTSYTSVLTDASKLVTMNLATANSFLIPTNASVAYPVGTTINVSQIGVGQTKIISATTSTTTINSTGAASGAPLLRAKFSAASCIKTATDVWLVVGDIS